MKISKICVKTVFPQIILATLGLIITLRAFFPGILTSDAIDQYQQGVTFIFGDWHPPIMSFIWAIINDWIPGAFGMLLFESLLYWGALLLLSLAIPQSHKKLSLSVIAVGFMPFTIGTLSHIWKDVLQAVVWLFAVGIICANNYLGIKSQKKLMLLAGFLLLFGSMTRFNAIFGLLPLVWLLFNRKRQYSWKKWMFIFILFPVSTIFLTGAFNYGFLNASKSRVYQSLIVFDIGGISHFSQKDYFKENWDISDHKKIISTCYDPGAWDVYAWGTCDFVLKQLNNSGSWNDGSLMKKWMEAIYHEPSAYLKHRYGNYMKLLWHPNTVLNSQTAKNSLGFHYEKTGMFKALEVTTNILKDIFIFKPGFWLIASFLFSFYGLISKKSFSRDVFLALNLSSFLYLLAYFFVGVASDYRYAYWSILATSVSVPFILLSRRTKK